MPKCVTYVPGIKRYLCVRKLMIFIFYHQVTAFLIQALLRRPPQLIYGS